MHGNCYLLKFYKIKKINSIKNGNRSPMSQFCKAVSGSASETALRETAITGSSENLYGFTALFKWRKFLLLALAPFCNCRTTHQDVGGGERGCVVFKFPG